MSQKHLIYLLLTLLLIMVALLTYIAGISESGYSSGLVHPLVSHMRVGGDGPVRFDAIGLPAFLLQAAVLILALVLIVLSISKRHRDFHLYGWLGICGAFGLFNWYMVYSSYQVFLDTGVVQYFLGFPLPSAWMIYGTWLSGLSLVVLYIVGFNRFIYTAQDELEYHKLIIEFKNSDATDSISDPL